MAVKELHIRNKNTGNVRVLDYHVADPDDPPDIRTMHDKHKPLVHVLFDIGEDEEVINERRT